MLNLVGTLRDLKATVTGKSGTTATLSISNGALQSTVTATEISYGSTATDKCLFIQSTDIANLNIDVSQSLKP